MTTAAIREQLHHFLEIADDKKLKAMFIMLEDSLKDIKSPYTDEYKAELDKRVEYYLKGGKMVTPAEMKSRLSSHRAKRS